MTEALSDLIEQPLTDVGLNTDELLWGALCLGLLLATVHLLTMLVTRWGDRKATSKSLIFSILLHMSCSMGLVAMHPPVQARTEPVEQPEPIQLRDVFVEGEETLEIEQRGNTPIWEKFPDPEKNELTRLDRLPITPDPLESPPRKPEPLTPPEIDVPDLPSLPDMPVATPQPASTDKQDVRAEAAVPLEIDDETAEARPEVQVPSTSTARQPVARTGQIDTSVSRSSPQGSVDRVARDLDLTQRLAAVDTAEDPRAYVKRSPVEEATRLRDGPAPSSLPVDEPGTLAERPQDEPAAGSAGPQRLLTVRARSHDSSEDGTLQRYRPERTPRSERSVGDAALAMRRSAPIDHPRDGPQPNVERPNFAAVRTRKNASIPSTYRLRNLDRRKETARQFGGTDESERAVEASLRWLALHQSIEGYWDADRFGAGQVKTDEKGIDRRYAGKRADTGLTALAVLAFLGAGYTHEDGQYAVQVDRALRWLVRQQDGDGYLGGAATHYAKNYCHAMATYALAEAYGMQTEAGRSDLLAEPLRRAVGYILDNQNPEDGGWRYVKGQPGDMSMFGWQLMALKSAEIAGIKIPKSSKDKMIEFLKNRSLGERNGLAGYRVGEPPTASMTAEALFCKQMLGIRRTNLASREAAEYLLKNSPRRSQTNMYYWYYGTLAMYQYGGEPWRKWNETLRELLVDEQRTTGSNAGSWDPTGPWGRYGGRLYSTTLCTLCLEVYYRFLPLYQMGGRYDEE